MAALVKSVGGSKVDVRSLVPVGASVETYEPAPADLVTLSRARLLVENGAGLEQWMAKLLRTTDGRLKTLVLSDGLLSSRTSVAQKPGTSTAQSAVSRAVNPHLWLDPIYAQVYISKIASALTSVQPRDAAYFEAGRRRENERLRALDVWIKSQIKLIPPKQRAMICFHDAWYYFDRRYGIRDVGAIETSPGQEPSAGYFAELVSLAKRNDVRAIFAEPQFSPKLAHELAQSAGIKTVTSLYDDTVGERANLATYEQIMRFNVSTIVQALRS